MLDPAVEAEAEEIKGRYIRNKGVGVFHGHEESGQQEGIGAQNNPRGKHGYCQEKSICEHLTARLFRRKNDSVPKDQSLCIEATRQTIKLGAYITKAIAHPSRTYIAEKLPEQYRCVCELTDMIGSDHSTISKHLGILKNAWIISDEKRGTSVYYQLEARYILKFIGRIETLIEQNFTKQASSVEHRLSARQEST